MVPVCDPRTIKMRVRRGQKHGSQTSSLELWNIANGSPECPHQTNDTTPSLILHYYGWNQLGHGVVGALSKIATDQISTTLASAIST